MTSSLHASSETFKPKAKSSYAFTDIVQMCCVTVFCLWVIQPTFSVNSLARMFGLAAMAVFLLVEVLKHPSTFLRPTPLTILVIFYGAYVNLAGYLADGMIDVTRNFSLNYTLLCLIVLEIYRRRDFQQLLWPAAITVVSSIIPVVITIFAMEQQRNVARIITRVSEEGTRLQSVGVGGFGLIYFICALLPAFVYFIRAGRASAPWARVFCFILLAAGIVLIARGGFFIALAVSAISVVVSLFFTWDVQGRLASTIMFWGLAACAAFIIVPNIGAIAPELAEGTMYERKVTDGLEFVSENEVSGTVEGRFERYQRSVTLFLENPVTGVISLQDIGKHSQLLDGYARFGIIIGSILPLAFFLVGRNLVKRFRGSLSSPMIVVTLVLGLVLILLNNIVPTMAVAFFIIMPAAAYAVFKGEQPSSPSRLDHSAGSSHGAG